jgi:recombination protein RecR
LAILKESTGYCSQCFNLTHAQYERCEVCRNPQRESNLICVVEDPLDVLAIERTEGFAGQYHVLHGALSPIEGIGPEDIKIRELLDRVEREEISEVILATNPTLDGDNTAMYLRKLLEPLGVRITRLARGLPVGGDLEYADQNTLRRALSGRSEM